MVAERVHDLAMKPNLKELILNTQRECTIVWNTKDGGSTGTMITYVWHKGSVWVLGGKNQPRVKAFRRNPSATIVVSSAGTGLGRERCISMRGICHIHDDATVADEVRPVFVEKVNINKSEGAAKTLTDMCQGADAVWLEIVPETAVTMDMNDMMLDILAK